jgi:gas vesicle protein
VQQWCSHRCIIGKQSSFLEGAAIGGVLGGIARLVAHDKSSKAKLIKKRPTY